MIWHGLLVSGRHQKVSLGVCFVSVHWMSVNHNIAPKTAGSCWRLFTLSTNFWRGFIKWVSVAFGCKRCWAKKSEFAIKNTVFKITRGDRSPIVGPPVVWSCQWRVCGANFQLILRRRRCSNNYCPLVFEPVAAELSNKSALEGIGYFLYDFNSGAIGEYPGVQCIQKNDRSASSLPRQEWTGLFLVSPWRPPWVFAAKSVSFRVPFVGPWVCPLAVTRADNDSS